MPRRARAAGKRPPERHGTAKRRPDPTYHGAAPADLRLLFDAMIELTALHELVYDEAGRAVDYRVLDCNAAFTKITGVPRETARGALASVLYGSDPAPYLDTYRKVAEGGGPVVFETYFPPMSKHFQISVVSPGKGLFATLASDITARREAELALSEREQLHSNILQTALDGFWIVDGEGRIREVNDSYCEMSGYSREELLTMSVWDLEAAESRAEAAHHMARILRQGGDRFESRHRVKSGQLIEVEVSVKSLPGPSQLLVCFVHDITKRKRAEEALQASEELFRTAFENASIGKSLIDLDGRYLRVNGALCQMLGYTADELLRLRWTDVTHPDDRPASESVMREAMAGVWTVRPFEKRYVGKQGQIVWVEVSASLVRSSSGSPLYFVNGVQNVTARREIEEQLRQSQKMEAVGQLAGGVAHDFNNLLSVMLSGCRFALEEAPADSQLRRDIEDVRVAAEKARDLTRQLLAFSRHQVAKPRVTNLNAIVRDAERILVRLLGANVELRSSLAPDLDLVLVDPGQIELVVLNLAINARDAMDSGGTLTLETSNVELPSSAGSQVHGHCVRVAVEDTGHGMDEKVRSRIFEPFFTTKPVGKGTGLGLSTVFGIVKQSGGSIRVDSAVGHGTRFEVYFPRA
jgi:two-component system, cell cycle sensor histidine kinase and response regulator CckA